MRRTLWIMCVVATMLVLSACSSGGGITISIPDRVDRTSQARTTDDVNLDQESTIATNLTIPGGEDRVIEVDVPATDYPALFVYIDEQLPMTVYRADGSRYATSRSSAFFGAGREGFQPASASALAPQIVSAMTCPGSCVIAPVDGSGTFFLEIDNTGVDSRTLNVWAVLRGFADENEEFSEADPMSVPLATTTHGAIETLGDTDYFVVEDDGQLAFDYFSDDTGLELVAEVFPFEGGDSFVIEPGDQAFVEFSDEVHVYPTNARAAVSGESTYTLYLQ